MLIVVHILSLLSFEFFCIDFWIATKKNLGLCIIYYRNFETKILCTFLSSQHGCTKGISWLTNLIAFYNEVTSLMDKRRALDIVYLNDKKKIKAFVTISHNTVDSEVECRWAEWPGQEVCVSKASWKQVTRDASQRLVAVAVRFNVFSNDLDDGAECTCRKLADHALPGWSH